MTKHSCQAWNCTGNHQCVNAEKLRKRTDKVVTFLMADIPAQIKGEMSPIFPDWTAQIELALLETRNEALEKAIQIIHDQEGVSHWTSDDTVELIRSLIVPKEDV